jgi:hypothetical protein
MPGCPNTRSVTELAFMANKPYHEAVELLQHTVKYRFPIVIRRRYEIRLRDEVCISKTKWLRCRGKVSESERNTEPYWKGKAWLQLVRCALLYAWCPISERDSEEDGVREEEYRAD